MAGTYSGKPQVLEMMGKGMGLFSQSDPLSIHVEQLVAEGDTVCAQFVLSARTARGKDYRNHYHFVFRVRGDQIVLVKEYVDTQYAHQTLFS
jgi:ketosteroid isomerase-like protein